MSLDIPTIRATSCPSSSELADKSLRWSIVYTSGGRGFIGRVVDVDDGETPGIVRLADCFDYASERRIVKGDRNEPRVQIVRQMFPCEHTDVDELLVNADVIIPLARMSPRLVESFREALIPAWEGRVHLRKLGGRIAVVGT